MKKMHCDTCRCPGTVTLNQGLRCLQAPSLAGDASTGGAPNPGSLMGFVMPQGSRWSATGKRKQK